MPQERYKELEMLWFQNQAEFMTWLEENHEQPEAIWLKYAKKASHFTSITYEQSREAAIIFGWIDGLIHGIDDDFYVRRFSARRPKSLWSQINRRIAEELIEQGRMRQSGIAEVDAAKQDGRWEAAYPPQSEIEVPPELQKQLDRNKKAKAFFESISKSNRYAFLMRIINAKRPETKLRHIQRTMEMLEAEQVYHPQPKKKIRKKK